MSRALWVVVGVVLIAVGVLGVISWTSNLDRETSTETFEGVTEFVFDVENSSIELVGGESELVVDSSFTTGFLGGSVALDRSGETVTLTQQCPLFIGFGCKAAFEVVVPAGTDVSGSTSNGAISAVGLDSPLEATTSNGAVDVEGLSANTSVATSNGVITGSGLSSIEFDARTSNGRIELTFVESPETVSLRTSNGAVTVVLPEDSPPYALTTSTSNGTVDAPVRTDPAASATIDVETSNGDITIEYGG